jgi:hypothetical protein
MEDILIACQYCDKPYKNAGSLEKHEQECKDKFHCRYCSKGLSSSGHCSNHEKTCSQKNKFEEKNFEVDVDLNQMNISTTTTTTTTSTTTTDYDNKHDDPPAYTMPCDEESMFGTESLVYLNFLDIQKRFIDEVNKHVNQQEDDAPIDLVELTRIFKTILVSPTLCEAYTKILYDLSRPCFVCQETLSECSDKPVVHFLKCCRQHIHHVCMEHYEATTNIPNLCPLCRQDLAQPEREAGLTHTHTHPHTPTHTHIEKSLRP